MIAASPAPFGPTMISVMRQAIVLGAALLLGASMIGACRGRSEPVPTAAPDTPLAASVAPPAPPSAGVGAAPSPPQTSPEDARRGNALAREAERCLDDLRCSAAEASRLYEEADDAGGADVSCFRFYYGILVPADARRARACFERVVRREGACGEQSPTLERLFLDLMLLDGQGGPIDVARGEALVAGCLYGNDSGVAAEVRARVGPRLPIDFCADIGGTGRNTEVCAQIDGDRAWVAARCAGKALVVELGLDDTGLALWRKADDALAGYVSDHARFVGDVFRNGSMRITQESSVKAAHERDHVDLIRALLDRKPSPEGAAEEQQKAEARAGAEPRDADNRKLLAASRAAWKAYRAAETALVRRALAGPYGGEAAALRALDAELGHRRAQALLDEIRARHGDEP
jgi:hypothetical protein